MRLSSRLFLGFTLAAACGLALVAYSLRVLRGVGRDTQTLAALYMPQTKMGHEIARQLLKAMVEMQGYQLSLEKDFLVRSRSFLEQVKGQLEEAQKFAAHHPALQTLKHNTLKAAQRLQEYESILRETENSVQAIQNFRKKLQKSAQEFMQACNEFAEGEADRLRRGLKAGVSPEQLQDTLIALTGIQEVIILGYVIQLDTLTSQMLRDPEILQTAMGKFHEMENELHGLQKKTKDALKVGLLEDIRIAATDYKNYLGKLLATMRQLEDWGKKRQEAENAVLAAALLTASEGIAETEKRAGEVDQILRRFITLMAGGTALAALLSVVLAFGITRSIANPLKGFISRLHGSAEELALASARLSSGSERLASGSTQQAAALQETSSSLEEMSSMARRNADNAGTAHQLAQEAQKILEKAGQDIAHLTQAMQGIAEASQETAKILKTIDEIAFQTNLLALNAAVEAARAGEAGTGFAVVAGEVRSLAQRAAASAKDTAHLLDNTLQKVNLGVSLVAETSGNFSALTASIKKVIDLVAEISGASAEQAQGVQQITQAMAEVDRVVQENAANAQEGAGASKELKYMADQLRQIVRELTNLIRGTGRQSHSGPASALPPPKETGLLPGHSLVSEGQEF